MTRSMLSGLVLLVVCSLFTPADAGAQNGFAVDLDVACDDLELRTLTRSYFSRELRELEDVRVGETTLPRLPRHGDRRAGGTALGDVGRHRGKTDRR